MRGWTIGMYSSSIFISLQLTSDPSFLRMLKDERLRYDPRKDWSLRDSAAQESERIDEGGTMGALTRQKEAMTTRRNEAGETLLDINDEELDWS